MFPIYLNMGEKFFKGKSSIQGAFGNMEMRMKIEKNNQEKKKGSGVFLVKTLLI